MVWTAADKWGDPLLRVFTTPGGDDCCEEKRDPFGGAKMVTVAGRPPLLTDELVERVGQLRRDGHSVANVAAQLSVSQRTVQRASALFREQAETALDEVALVAAMERAAAVDWRAATWLLERRWPERWAHPSTRRRTPPSGPVWPEDDDPFRELDELAEARRRRMHDHRGE